jgi:hypothetical protein
MPNMILELSSLDILLSSRQISHSYITHTDIQRFTVRRKYTTLSKSKYLLAWDHWAKILLLTDTAVCIYSLFRRPSNLHCMAKWRHGGHGQMCLGGIRELPHLWG